MQHLGQGRMLAKETRAFIFSFLSVVWGSSSSTTNVILPSCAALIFFVFGPNLGTIKVYGGRGGIKGFDFAVGC